MGQIKCPCGTSCRDSGDNPLSGYIIPETEIDQFEQALETHDVDIIYDFTTSHTRSTIECPDCGRIWVEASPGAIVGRWYRMEP